MYNYGYPPLIQSLVAQHRTPADEHGGKFFHLEPGQLNGVPTWFGTGYAVITNSPSGTPLYPLYRFTTNRPVARAGAVSNLLFQLASPVSQRADQLQPFD